MRAARCAFTSLPRPGIVRYCMKLFRKEISPRIATWIFFEVGVMMSLASYLAENDHSLIEAALNAADSFQVTVILLALVIEQRGRRIEFTRNELVSLAISCAAALAWILTKTGWIGFVGFQLVMSVALPADPRKSLALEIRAVAGANGEVGHQCNHRFDRPHGGPHRAT